MDKKVKENRCYSGSEVRADMESRRVEGYALVFNQWSEDIGFREMIKPEAVTPDMIAGCDVMALLNHDEHKGVLARSKKGKGSLSLSVDDHGLAYAFDAPKTALGDELLENIRRGEIDSSSFCFSVAEDEWEKDADGNYTRKIDKIEAIYDVSPVYQPAYAGTSADLRGKDKLDEELNRAKAAEEAAKAEAEKKQKALDDEFERLNSIAL
jgi:HK97 family phage prohead protease